MMYTEQFIYLLIVVACILAGLYTRYALQNCYVMLFLFVSFISDLQTFFIGAEWPSHIYHALEYTLLALAYKKVLKGHRVKKFITQSIPIFWMFFAGGALIDGWNSLSTTNMCISQNAIIIYGLIYIKDSYEPPFTESSVLARPFFWINAANLFYFSGLFINLTVIGIFTDLAHSASMTIYILSTMINMLYFVILFIGLTCTKLFR